MTIAFRPVWRHAAGWCFGLLLALRGVAAAGEALAGGDTPECPRVDAALSATIDTKKVKAGERFHFATLAPLTYGTLTIPQGTLGTGLVATLDHSRSEGHSGYLVLEARYLELANGTHVPVALLPGGDGHSEEFVRAGSSGAGAIGYLPFYIGTAAGIYNTFHHGKDAAVVAGTRMPLMIGDAFYTGDCRVDIDQR